MTEKKSSPSPERTRPRLLIARPSSSATPRPRATPRAGDVVAAARRFSEVAAILRAAAAHAHNAFYDHASHRATHFLRRPGEGARAARYDVLADVQHELGMLAEKYDARARELVDARVDVELSAEDVGELPPFGDEIATVAELGSAGRPPPPEEA